ncbi:hypothetical protein [Rhodoferax sp.]|uniref:hypothetical protein n=1 Tax=Rhodoferax sp. TaxID=50421 RepID=UPI002ACD9429|nr:hypothetical protein [Rhodoferax sp.]MDZ7918514.1 hypothetical protein [Rhodoferax sp.]
MCSSNAVLALQGAGAASSAIGAYGAATCNKIALGGQADIADINARMAESTAQGTLLTGQREEQKATSPYANLKGTQRANLAANGVDLGVSGGRNILTTTDVMGQIDANTIQANAVRSAWGYRAQAANFTNQANGARSTTGAINPGMAAFTSLIGSAGKVAAGMVRHERGRVRRRTS